MHVLPDAMFMVPHCTVVIASAFRVQKEIMGAFETCLGAIEARGLDVHHDDGGVVLQVVLQPLDGVQNLARCDYRSRLPHQLRHPPLQPAER